MKENEKNIQTINYKGKDYKLVFNLNSMQEIQEEYGSIEKWAELTDGSNKEQEIDIKALKFGILAMINEGLDIEAEEKNIEYVPITSKTVGRILTEVGMKSASAAAQNTIINSIPETSKNA